MILKNFDRISRPNHPSEKGAVDINLMQKTHIVGVGSGGAYCLYDGLTRSGLGKLTVLDFDEVEEVNIVRQGFETPQIDKKKVDALGEHLKLVNSGMEYTGITDNFLHMSDEELDGIFGKADLFLFMTDSFEAQAFGNKLALRYGKPAIWAGFYEKSRCAEIMFQIPGVTPACFRCAVSPRYKAQEESKEEIRISSGCNTMFHSQLLDAYVGMISFAILHNQTTGFEYSNWFGTNWDRNLIQIKVHPTYGTEKDSLFDRVFSSTEGRCPTFNAIWQKIEPELPPKYEHCPDCNGEGVGVRQITVWELSGGSYPKAVLPRSKPQVEGRTMKIPTEYISAYQKGLLDFTEGQPQKTVINNGGWLSFLDFAGGSAIKAKEFYDLGYAHQN